MSSRVTRFSGGLTSSRWATRPELELDERAHRVVSPTPSVAPAAAKSAARPIGPDAYRRRSIGRRSPADPGPEAHPADDVAFDVDPGCDLDQDEAVVLEREHRAGP